MGMVFFFRIVLIFLCWISLGSLLSSPILVSVRAWSCEGHMLVAEIARRHLNSNARLTLERAMQSFSLNGPFPRATDMVEAACWMDDIKMYHQWSMNYWHFIDQEVRCESIESLRKNAIEDADWLEDATSERENIREKLLIMVRSLYSNSDLPPYMIEFALVQIIHLMGDIHQPLHCASFFSSRFPNGDRGGNEILVRADGVRLSLHSLWDKLGEPYLPSLPRPLSASDRSRLEAWADRLEKRYVSNVSALLHNISNHANILQRNASTKLYSSFSPKTYSSESYRFAVNTSYGGIVKEESSNGCSFLSGNAWWIYFFQCFKKRENVLEDCLPQTQHVLTEKYLKEARSVARQRVVLAGLRLAMVFNDLFASGVPLAYKEKENISQNKEDLKARADSSWWIGLIRGKWLFQRWPWSPFTDFFMDV